MKRIWRRKASFRLVWLKRCLVADHDSAFNLNVAMKRLVLGEIGRIAA